ncbi:histidine kinase [Paenibacillus sp. BIHB 4019]|uniref:histidine kinase n=1 Tax=Paenibacillus sp. BIHB 4019 TaxID=1870819 RepID=A0A1B2DJY6_9BACL|nr:sensor histidine kinase [Paenibacillus sp. BIHB 4019]ANY68032.1 histidine kinase [Paenibacillus sp. BIHB 4019]
MLSRLRIYWKMILLSFGLVLLSLLIGGIVVIGSVTRMKEDELKQRLLITARTVAELPSIKNQINEPDSASWIAPVADNIRIINNVAYVVVLDMNRTRLSHPLAARIGGKFESADADAAFAEHTYMSKVKGEAGVALRAYVPVMNEAHEQVGVVVAGGLLPGLAKLIEEQQSSIALTLLIALLFGIFGSALLARHIKRQMYNLEPHEIARMYGERSAAFQAMHEGVIAIDRLERITIFNERARQIFSVSRDVVGLSIREVLPDTRLPEIMELERPVFNQELRVGNALIWSNRIPIREQGKIIGAIAIFQDRTEVARMAEELTGVQEFVDALRVQNHEHSNKLHTIAGLLQLDKKEQALQYVYDISGEQEELTQFLHQHIADDSLAGLLLGKISRGKELGIQVKLDPHMEVKQFPIMLDQHDMVLLIGNLIENAFDALAKADRTNKEIYVSMEQDEELLSILVEDNGCGMTEEVQSRVLERGFTTKGSDNRGIGLYLVGSIVHKGDGELRIQSELGSGTVIELTFPMGGAGG